MGGGLSINISTRRMLQIKIKDTPERKDSSNETNINPLVGVDWTESKFVQSPTEPKAFIEQVSRVSNQEKGRTRWSVSQREETSKDSHYALAKKYLWGGGIYLIRKERPRFLPVWGLVVQMHLGSNSQQFL